MTKLKNNKIAILATDGFEEIELTAPRDELKAHGVEVDIVSDKPVIKSWKHRDWGSEFSSDRLLDRAEAEEYDALILPGGVVNPDLLRRNKKSIDFIKAFSEDNKMIAAICHGPQMLIEADLVKNKEMTSFYSIRTDLINAGAKWKDEPVVIDGNLITSRNPDDIPSFMKKIFDKLKVE